MKKPGASSCGCCHVRVEAETRNVQTLARAGSLEQAASAACDLFSTCVEAGLQVCVCVPQWCRTMSARQQSVLNMLHTRLHWVLLVPEREASSFLPSHKPLTDALCYGLRLILQPGQLTAQLGMQCVQAEAVRLLLVLAEVHTLARQPTLALPYALSAWLQANELHLDVLVRLLLCSISGSITVPCHAMQHTDHTLPD